MQDSLKKKEIYWKYLGTETLKHLNMVEGAPVRKDFFDTLECIGVSDWSKVRVLFDNDEWVTVTWIADRSGINLSDNVFFFKVLVKQQLRLPPPEGDEQQLLQWQGSAQIINHSETWLMGLFRSSTKGRYFLCPLKRDSDFPIDLFKLIEENCKVEMSFPWARHSSVA